MNRTPAVKRKEFIVRTREDLKSMKAALIHELAADVQAAQSADGGGSEDSADLASKEFEQRVNVILSERERDRIIEIDYALRQMDERDYGICEACGFEISELRLQTMPFTRHCRDCQEDRERKAKGQRCGNDFEQRWSKEFGSESTETETGREPMRRLEVERNS